MIAGALACSPALAADCKFIGGVTFGGVEPPLAVDGTCRDPNFNESNFVLDKVTENLSLGPDYPSMPYTRVQGHFTPTKKASDLPPDLRAGSPTTVNHNVDFFFPAKAIWQNRFYQSVYPVGQGSTQNFDPAGRTAVQASGLYAAFLNGAYVVRINPGASTVGYRVDAAAAKIAKGWANKLYNNSGRIYGYIFGSSGGSMQSVAAAEGTTGVWDGSIPTVLASDGLNTHSFDLDSLYALAIPQAKREAIMKAAAPGSHGDIFAGLNGEEKAALEEYLRGGFPRGGLETYKPDILSAVNRVCCDVDLFDPGYEEDFWSKPGYEGFANAPSYLAAAKVDGYATIAGIVRNASGAPVSISFDAATVPRLGSIGANGLRYYVYGADGKTRVRTATASTLTGTLNGATLTLTGNNSAALVDALAVGGKIRINNRFLLAMIFYPRHSIIAGNQAYDQYRDAGGKAKYPQRTIEAWLPASTRTSAGLRQQGRLKLKTMVMNSILDVDAYPFSANWYANQVTKSLGPKKAEQMFRIYIQDSAEHGGGGGNSARVINYSGIRYQALRDLSAWVEKGIAPPASTRFREVGTQLILPKSAAERRGLQPVVALTVNGGDRVEISAGQSVTLEGRMEVPPGGGKIVSYDWNFGGTPAVYETATVLATPQPTVTVKRDFVFPTPGTYLVALRTMSQRDGKNGDLTAMPNVTRVQVVVR